MRRWVGGLLVCLGLAVPVYATHLTEAQYTTLNSYLDGIAELDDEIAAQQWSALATFCNATAAPSYWVWRPAVTEEEMTEGAGWSWPQYVGKSRNQQGAWERMFRTGSINMASSSVRSGLAEIFFGESNLTHIQTTGRREATRCEQLYSTGVGAGTTGDPDIMSYEGSITDQDVAHAFGYGPAHN